MRIAFWATTFQADTQALACYLAAQEDHQVLVALKEPERYRSQPVERFLPLLAETIDRESMASWWRLAKFDPDVLIVDNHLPPFPPRRLFVLWHGYGWRVDHPTRMRKNMAQLVGDVTRPNPRFRWQSFGDYDTTFTAGHRKIHPDNIIPLGSAYSDLLRPASPLRARFDPALVAADYPGIDLAKPTVLIGMTWHHGGLLGHWGEEWDLLGKLLDHIEKRGGNTILRMHDRFRYEPSYLKQMASFCANREVLLKFKSESPDSLVDLLVSDIMVTNYSSFANAWYYTERPCLHIVPPEAGEGLAMRQWSSKGVSAESVVSRDAFWKHPPEDVGGLRAHTFEQLLEQVDQALEDPSCCGAIARDYISRHIHGMNGRTCRRIEDALYF